MANMAEKQDSVNEFEADASTAGRLCSICQTTIIAGERICTCPHCTLPFHGECWKENRGCSAYGCEGASKVEQKAPAVVEPVSDAWAGEKPCPSCGRTIKAQALKCRFCGAAFDTRNVITRDEFKRREYEGTEYTSARNKIIALFLLSAAGCLSPLALLLACILVSQKNLMGIDYNRLPATLKAVVVSSIGISSLLLFIMAMLVLFD
jgi:hypothetical protein